MYEHHILILALDMHSGGLTNAAQFISFINRKNGDS